MIVFYLGSGRSPMRAAFWGVVTAIALSLLRPETRLSRSKLGDVLLRAGKGSVQVAAACAAAGIVVGVASLTGIGLRMSELIVTLSGGQLPIALLLTALGSIVLGMGLPTTAAYVVLAALGAPALTELGVPLLSAHMFIFYFGCISNVTPPVSLAAFAAAGVAESPPMRTAFTAMVLAIAGFIVPFMFVYGPGLLLQASVGRILLTTLTALIGIIAIAAAAMGYGTRLLGPVDRVLLAAGAMGLIVPHIPTDVGGLIVIGFVLFRPTRARTAAVATLALTLGLAGCSGEGGRRFLSIGTGGTGGIYYPLGGAQASQLSLADETRTYTAEVTGASVENVNRVIAGEIDVAFALAMTPYQAQQNGQTGADGLRLIAPALSEPDAHRRSGFLRLHLDRRLSRCPHFGRVGRQWNGADVQRTPGAVRDVVRRHRRTFPVVRRIRDGAEGWGDRCGDHLGRVSGRGHLGGDDHGRCAPSRHRAGQDGRVAGRSTRITRRASSRPVPIRAWMKTWRRCRS